MSTLAGSGMSTWLDGVGTVASFQQMYGIIADSNLNVFVIEAYRVRLVTREGDFLHLCFLPSYFLTHFAFVFCCTALACLCRIQDWWKPWLVGTLLALRTGLARISSSKPSTQSPLTRREICSSAITQTTRSGS